MTDDFFKQAHTIFPVEVTERVICSSLNEERSIEIGMFRGENALRPDRYTSWVEFALAHAFPVVTTDGLALHPQVIANSFKGLFAKVFNLGHVIRAYNPEENARDRIVGSIFAAEFPPTPIGGWKVQAKRSAAPGIRAVACMHKQAEGVDKILGQHKSGRRRWTVSRENDYFLEDSGFLIKAGEMASYESVTRKETDRTPKDIAELGLRYVACVDAPEDLLDTYDAKNGKMRRKDGPVLLVGGLNGYIHFKGTGLTPLGKEAEAEIQQMLASGAALALDESGSSEMADFLAPLKNFSELLDCHLPA